MDRAEELNDTSGTSGVLDRTSEGDGTRKLSGNTGARRFPDGNGGKGKDSKAGNQDGTGSVDPGQLSSTPERSR